MSPCIIMWCAKQIDFRAVKVQFNCKMSHHENFLYAIFLFSWSSSPENMQWDAGGDRFHVRNLLGLTTLGGGSWPDLYIHAAAEGRGFKERSAGAGAAGNRMKSWPQPSEVQTWTPPSLSAAWDTQQHESVSHQEKVFPSVDSRRSWLTVLYFVCAMTGALKQTRRIFGGWFLSIKPASFTLWKKIIWIEPRFHLHHIFYMTMHKAERNIGKDTWLCFKRQAQEPRTCIKFN